MGKFHSNPVLFTVVVLHQWQISNSAVAEINSYFVHVRLLNKTTKPIIPMFTKNNTDNIQSI